MSVNASYATPQSKKHNRWGKFYWGIDFDLNRDLTESEIIRGAKAKEFSPVLGKLQLNNYEFELTEKEVRRLMETLNDAMLAVKKSYSLGLYR